MPQKKKCEARSSGRYSAANVKAVDLFCGAGGLTRGLEAAGINVVTGVDIDPVCEYPFTANNRATFLLKSVEEVAGQDFAEALKGDSSKVLAGCSPSQPFSTYRQGKSSRADKRWNLLSHFARLVKEVRPDLVSMENVPLLEKEEVFAKFVSSLKDDGFSVFHKV